MFLVQKQKAINKNLEEYLDAFEEYELSLAFCLLLCFAVIITFLILNLNKELKKR